MSREKHYLPWWAKFLGRRPRLCSSDLQETVIGMKRILRRQKSKKKELDERPAEIKQYWLIYKSFNWNDCTCRRRTHLQATRQDRPGLLWAKFVRCEQFPFMCGMALFNQSLSRPPFCSNVYLESSNTTTISGNSPNQSLRQLPGRFNLLSEMILSILCSSCSDVHSMAAMCAGQFSLTQWQFHRAITNC